MLERLPGNDAGVSFGDMHSWFDWGLRLSNVSIGLPEPRTVYVDVPGRNGSLDLTEAQHGGIVYGNRTLVFTFDALTSYEHWSMLLSAIANAIQGRKVRIILDSDPDFYYVGRCSIETEKANSVLASITITCDCDPFKRPTTSLEEFAGMQISSPSAWTEISIQGWPFNEALEITCSADMLLKYNSVEYELGRGLNIMSQIDLAAGKNLLYLKGTGTVTITQQGGML